VYFFAQKKQKNTQFGQLNALHHLASKYIIFKKMPQLIQIAYTYK